MKPIVVITGTSKGIGLALAEKLLESNYTVIGTSTSGKVPAISDQNFEALPLDLSDPKSINDFISVVKSKNITIELLINNAAVGTDLGFPVAEEKTFDETFAINVKGTVFFTEAMLTFVSEGGKILNISSRMGSITHCERSSSPAYSMSKTALNMYTKLLSNRLNGKIDVAAIHPGWVQTTISDSNVNAPLTPEDSAERIVNYIQSRFQNGDFWDAERHLKLQW